MLVELTHPEQNYEFFIESEEIAVLERYNKPVSTILSIDDKPSVTAIVLKSGRIMSCKETPKQILEIIKRG